MTTTIVLAILTVFFALEVIMLFTKYRKLSNEYDEIVQKLEDLESEKRYNKVSSPSKTNTLEREYLGDGRYKVVNEPTKNKPTPRKQYDASNSDLTEINYLLNEILEINFRNDSLSSAAQSILIVLNKFYKMDYVTIFLHNEVSQHLSVIASNAGNEHLDSLDRYCNGLYSKMNGVASKVQASELNQLTYPSARIRGIHFSNFTLLMFDKKIIGAILLENKQASSYINDTIRQDLYEKVISKTSLVLKNVLHTENLINMTSTDQLTNVHNRRFIDMTLPEQLNIHRNLDLGFSVAMLDIDKFKSFNDTYGHQYGDLVLKEVAKFMNNYMKERENHWVARYGGEEFVLFFGRSNPQEVELALEHLRQGIQDMILSDGQTETSVTASFGVCHYPQIITNATGLIQKADKALYYSKEHGRNRVTVFTPELDSLATDK